MQQFCTCGSERGASGNWRPYRDLKSHHCAGVNPLDGTNYLDTVSAFIEGFLHLLAGEGVWGRGRHLSPFPQ